LVEFAANAQPGLAELYGPKQDLEQLLGRGVDLVERGAVRTTSQGRLAEIIVLDQLSRSVYRDTGAAFT
jgi:predicted nucleotidyltransferase